MPPGPKFYFCGKSTTLATLQEPRSCPWICHLDLSPGSVTWICPWVCHLDLPLGLSPGSAPGSVTWICPWICHLGSVTGLPLDLPLDLSP